MEDEPFFAFTPPLKAVEFLSSEAMAAHVWEAALTLRLPPCPSRELLEEARQEVVTYLDWYSHEGDWNSREGPLGELLVEDIEIIKREIGRAATRLIELTIAIGRLEL